MTRGRKPKTPEQRELHGSKSRPSHEKDPPEYKPGLPDCPDFLDEEAKAEWERLAERLYDAGTLTHEARSTMVGYCVAWSMFVDAHNNLQKYGSVLVSPKTGWPGQSPYFNMVQSAMKSMNLLASSLGLDPVSRGRVQAIKPKIKDPKDRFFK